ncbi:MULTISPECIES: hypothetical protein [unclassified Pseudomonas]|uniref:hypothetical protein n=1 Tax=unclassified Pseudomonas TaxID=196821 RepID=UPI000D8BDACE|nr:MULTISPECIES: hypothetical protein [unclassified Pseudomonas]PYG83223.1 hypothetical protein N428_00514 [Pseudomonas sp. RV120224-01c]PYG86419.1 hypothetical protein N436_00513 [Pseudomonas sp. RV120224-01b]
MAAKKTAATDAAASADESAVLPGAEGVDTTAVEAEPAGVTFTDRAFTSRSLFLQAGDDLREFKVLAGRVTVQADDAEALAFLRDHADLQQLDG